MSLFCIPRTVHYGSGVVSELKNIPARKAAIVMGHSAVKANGALDKITALLRENSVEFIVIDGVENNPTISTVLTGAKKMQEFEPDMIIGLGGGSPIDGAKAMWTFYEYPDLTFEQACVPFTLPTLRKKAIFVAVTTTSGTGTEVTSFAVITDDKTGIKYPMADYNLTPDFAIVDTDLVESLTPTLVAHTGMDAVTHAIEAYVSVVAADVTDALAVKTLEMADQYLVASQKGDMEARGKMHIAQCLAGMSFSNAILGIVHSMAHKSGVILDVPHGCANTIYLPLVIAFNGETAPAKYADIARRLGLTGACDACLVSALVEYINKLNASLGIPATLKEFGVAEDVFTANLDKMAEAAVGDPCTGTNPRTPSVEEMKNLFMLAYYGK